MSGPFIEFYKNFNLNIYFIMFAYDVLSSKYLIIMLTMENGRLHFILNILH